MSAPAADGAVQDFYPDDFAHCYGCGRLNEHGLHVRTHWEGEETVSRYTPRAWETAVPGFVYGGLIASLIDCHAMGTAAAAMLRAAGQDVGAAPSPRFVTASLRVDYLQPTPLGPELVIRARVRQASDRKVVVDATVSVGDAVTARGEAVAVRMPATMVSGTQ
jgi:acyl-coenzyme A thioesterase PaaI-like protein